MSYSSPTDLDTIMTTKKPQPTPWSHQQTLNLIQAYQEKWYSLKRGSLKAAQWEELALTVASRCGLAEQDAKSATQCRHKMEKLRRRYRAELQTVGDASPWPYFHAMDALDRGPFPISARPLTSLRGRENRSHENGFKEIDSDDFDEDNEFEEEEEVEEVEEDDEGMSKSRSINYILRRPCIVNRFSGLFQNPLKRRRFEEGVEDIVEVNDGIVEGEEGRGGAELALEIRRFADRFAGMERMRMEMMKDTERYRMEMEQKRIGMILDSQRKIVDLIARSFGS